MARRIAAAAVLVAAALVGVFAGFDGLLVFGVLAVVAAAFAYAMGAGGEWLQRSSRRRFDEDERRR